jgi:hypothetical protein
MQDRRCKYLTDLKMDKEHQKRNSAYLNALVLLRY